MARWNLNSEERENLRLLLGQLLLGQNFNPEKPLVEQILDGEGFIMRLLEQAHGAETR